jgi:hypothetical protein
VSTANTASTNASNAVTTANTASSNATTAVNTANSAVTTANNAAAAVANAQIFTIVAAVANIPGSPANNAAVEVTNSTGIESFTPLAGKPAGFIGNSGLSVRITYSTSGSTWNWVQYFPNDPESRYLKTGTGTVTSTNIADGTIVNADISATAAIAPSKISGTAVVDSDARLTDTRTPTDGSVTNAKVNASAAIAGTKISPDFGSQNVTTTGTATAAALIPSGSSVPTNGVYLPSANNVAISTNGTGRLVIDANGNLLAGTGALGFSGKQLTLKSGQGYVGLAVSGTESTIFSSWDSSATPLLFTLGGTERMRLDSSGRLGLGTSSPQVLLDITDTGNQPKLRLSTATASNFLEISRSSSTGHYTFASEENGSSIIFATDPDGTGAQSRVTIDRYGKVGIGTTSPATRLNVFESTGASLFRLNGLNGYNLDIANNFDSGTRYDFNIGSGSGAFSFTTSAGERARIDSSGRLLVGTSTALGPSTTSTGITLYPNDYSVFSSAGNEPITVNRNNDGAIVSCRRSGVSVGSISVTTTATAFNTSSDYRLKENVVPLIGAVDRLNQLQVHRFNFIADPDKTVDGFIAHEAQAVVPECVTGTKDAVDADGNPVYQGIDQSKLVPLLTAALQEAIGRIETLEAKVAALEGV